MFVVKAQTRSLRRRLLCQWPCLFLVLCPLLLGNTTPRSPSPLQLELDALYSARFVLSATGTPTITVAVAEGIQQVRVSMSSAGTATWFNAAGQKKRVGLSARQEWSVRLVRGTPAQVRFWLSPFVVPVSQKLPLSKLRRFWKKRGQTLRLKTVGSVFSVQGRWVDNRRRVGILRVYSSKNRAIRMAATLSENQPMPLRLHEELVKRASGVLQLSGQGQSIRSQSLLRLAPNASSGTLQVDWIDQRGRSRSRRYQGTLEIVVGKDGRLAVLNRVPVPSYLRGVLPSEMPARAPLEALKAQAVCARNEVMAKIGGRHHADPFLFCASTHCQVYHGHSAAHSRTDRAIRETRGRVMWHPQGRLADAYYSAVSGGHTEHNEHVWFLPADPMLRGKPDLLSSKTAYSRGISHRNIRSWLRSPPLSYSSGRTRLQRRRFRWVRVFSASRMKRMVERRYRGMGEIVKLEPLKRGVSGRIYKLRIVGRRRTVIVYGELRIRRLLGNLRSSMFVVEASPSSGSQVWKLLGGGWGHGVGMCQWGAIERARRGQNFQTILHHYYTTMRLLRLY